MLNKVIEYSILEELSETFAGYWVYGVNEVDDVVEKTPFTNYDDAYNYYIMKKEKNKEKNNE